MVKAKLPLRTYAVIAAAAGTFVVGCSMRSAETSTARPDTVSSCGSRFLPTQASQHEMPAWILTTGGLARLQQSGLSPWLLADFNRPSTLLLAAHGQPDRLAPRATLAFTFTSAAALEGAVKQGTVPDSVRYLLLDLERWPLTPLAEQLDPIGALKAAVSVAHAHGKCVVFTPALDLTRIPFGRAGKAQQFAAFERTIAGPGALVSDVFEVQSQQTEHTSFVNSFAARTIATVRRYRPREPIFVGLSTNPNGRQVSPFDILTLYRSAAASSASGYWLNIPQTSAECPKCGLPHPGVAVEFLKILAQKGWKIARTQS